MFILFFTSLFFQNYAAFFINTCDIKFYSNFKKNLIFLLLMLYLIFIDQAVNCISIMGIYLPMANGDVITKWDVEFVTEITKIPDVRRM